LRQSNCRDASIDAMPFKPTRLTSNAILRALARAPQGLSAEQLKTALETPVDKRTIQRRLKSLLDSSQIRAVGTARARRYFSVSQSDEINANFALTDLPLSSAAQEILRLISLPETQRQPVGYNRSWLDAYKPNETFYLSRATRDRLAKVGRGQVEQEAPAGTYARQLLGRLLIDLAWNSSRLEGNTYSLLDTERLLAEGKAAEGKSAQEAQMILNHKLAIEFLVDSAFEIGFRPFVIQNLHATLADNLLPDPSAPGRLRKVAVAISGSVFHPLETPQLIEEAFRVLLAKAEAIEDPYEQAFFAMVHLPYLQPFDDVNKRVSRLSANIPLIRSNLTPISFKDVPSDIYLRATLAVYELNRTELLADVFVWAVERSAQVYRAVRQSLGEPDPFRLRWRDAIRSVIADAVRQRLDRSAAIAAAEDLAETLLPTADRSRFRSTVISELDGLHEGNFARYQLKPSEFQAWRLGWR
jgi:Fic/DOC family